MSKAAGHDFTNVVNFSPIQEQRKPAYYPPLLTAGKGFALNFLDKSLKKLFNNADDCLFEYADKAQNNQQQTYYFDAMRQLRVKRDSITNAFFQAFEISYKNCVEGLESDDLAWSLPKQDDALSLVEESDLELNLAIINMEQRIQSECREQLSGLLFRLNELGCITTFNRSRHPFSAQSICKSFSHAVEAMDFELEIQLIVYKLFDKFVVRDMKQLYAGINDIFIKAGILPNIRYRVPPIQHGQTSAKAKSESPAAITDKTPAAPAATHRAPGSVENGAALLAPTTPANAVQFHNSDDLFAAMRRLIAAPLPHPSAVAAAASTVNSLEQVAVAPTFISADHLIKELSGLQSNITWQNLSSAGLSTVQRLQHVIAEQNDGSCFNRIDADTINIVALMFEMILDDEQIPQDIKQQINRLQIPYIKVAMLDKGFFSNKKHAARLLLNELSRSFEAIDADESEYQSLYQKIVAIVDEVIEKFSVDMQIFSRLLKELREFVCEEKSINQQADNMLLQAKEKAALELEKRIADHRLPRHLLQFLLGPWKEVLTRVALREKDNPKNWKRYIRCIDQLIWSVQNKSSRFERQALADLLPDLLASIKGGLAVADIQGDEQQSLLKELQEMHIAALKSEFSSVDDVEKGVTSHVAASQKDGGLWEEIDAQNIRHQDYLKELHDSSLMQSPFYNTATEMALGTWLRFRDGDKVRKGKLAWRCDFTGEYIFMTRLYKVVADVNLKELIAKLEAGDAAVEEQLPLFDRAVNAIFRKISSRKLNQAVV